jgi:ADP-ribose diphosphatase
MSQKTLPKITHKKIAAKSRLFTIEQLELTFSNGVQREYERMLGSGRGAVMVVPMIDDDTMLLVKEYCAGTHSYELGFPKGLIDADEVAIDAANRELKEEIFHGANSLIPISEMMMAPAFFNAKMTVFIGRDLYQEKLPGDEPEPLDIVPWKLSNYKALLSEPTFKEARSIAALMLVKDYLEDIL